MAVPGTRDCVSKCWRLTPGPAGSPATELWLNIVAKIVLPTHILWIGQER
jgi:hypothetical protein